MNNLNRHSRLPNAVAKRSAIPRTPNAEIIKAGVIVPEIGRSAESGFKASRVF